MYVHYSVGLACRGGPDVSEGSNVNITSVPSSRARRPRHHLLVVLAALSIIGPALPRGVGAAEQERIVALGESNSDTQRGEVLGFLDASNADRLVSVTVDETVRSMEGVFDVAGIDTAFSSSSLTCPAKGSGIDVKTRNIEIIPPELFALALLTAGMSDVQLAVAAPNDALALGMTAMAGVFKTWEMGPCSESGSDPVRRQLALEELALIADIGQELEAVRQTSVVVLDVQREIISKRVAIEELDALVTKRSAVAGLELGAGDQADIVAFLDRLSRAELDWGPFARGWSTRYTDDRSGVVLMATKDTGAEGRARGILAKVTTPVMDAFHRWWPLAALAGAFLVLGMFVARRLFSRGR